MADDKTSEPVDVVEVGDESGKCQTCGQEGLLSRIRARLSGGEMKICRACLDAYRRGDSTIAGIVVPRLTRP